MSRTMTRSVRDQSCLPTHRIGFSPEDIKSRECHFQVVELNQFGIGIKTIEPGGIRTDFFTRSLDTGRHSAYDSLVNKFMGMITDPEQMATYSTPEQIAEVVYEAATDGKDQLRYIAGEDAK